MENNILKQIFFDENQHWAHFIEKYRKRIRPVVLKEVEKFGQCGDSHNGFKLFVCEACHSIRTYKLLLLRGVICLEPSLTKNLKFNL